MSKIPTVNTISTTSIEYAVKIDSTIPQEEIQNVLSFFPRGLVALDLETTGLSSISDQIIEIGAVKISADGEIRLFQTLINPRIIIPEYTIAVHNITNEMVASSPIIEDVMPKFIEFIDNLPIVAQNAKFDLGFLSFCIYRHGYNVPDSEIFDSCRIGRRAINNLKSYNLSSLASALSIPLGNHHRAISDAYVCLRVFSKSLLMLSKTTNWNTILNVARVYKWNSALVEKMCFELPPNLQMIVPKVSAQEIVEIKYEGGSLKGQYRPIKPIGFIPLPHGLVLYGLCVLSQTNKSFLAKKISSIRFLDSVELQRWNQRLASASAVTAKGSSLPAVSAPTNSNSSVTITTSVTTTVVTTTKIEETLKEVKEIKVNDNQGKDSKDLVGKEKELENSENTSNNTAHRITEKPFDNIDDE